MIHEEDLLEAIAECQGQRNPDARTCIKLAAYYTILDHLKERDPDVPERFMTGYSGDAGEGEETVIGNYGTTDFLQLIRDQKPEAVWSVMDELMSTLQMFEPRLYDATMRKLTV